MNEMNTRLVYVMDPMCAWCYAFQRELEAFQTHFPELQIDWIMGGLAPDNDTPMDDALARMISGYWHDIEQRTGVEFNHSYWDTNTPYRSTFLACRAVITTERIAVGKSVDMVKAIQHAYYQDAKNPSLVSTLVECAEQIGLDVPHFSSQLDSPIVEQTLISHLSLAQNLNVSGFPALFYVDEYRRAYQLTEGYCLSTKLIETCNCLSL